MRKRRVRKSAAAVSATGMSVATTSTGATSSQLDCDSVCPIARALSVVGDRWTLLIMRELNMGMRRFDDLQAMTGMSSFLLSTRLKRLERDELIEKRRYSARPPRYEYHATPKGKDLDEVLLMLRAWSMKWQTAKLHEEPAVNLVYKRTKAVVDVNWRPPSGKPFSFDDTEGTIGRAFAAERDGRRKAFIAARRRGN
jgi:DNA-binding HxlR family transcriptional regulator